MKNLRPSGKADEELHEPEGLEVHISHEHLAKLGYKVRRLLARKYRCTALAR
jgi:hypothetical protein